MLFLDLHHDLQAGRRLDITFLEVAKGLDKGRFSATALCSLHAEPDELYTSRATRHGHHYFTRCKGDNSRYNGGRRLYEAPHGTNACTCSKDAAFISALNVAAEPGTAAVLGHRYQVGYYCVCGLRSSGPADASGFAGRASCVSYCGRSGLGAFDRSAEVYGYGGHRPLIPSDQQAMLVRSGLLGSRLSWRLKRENGAERGDDSMAR